MNNRRFARPKPARPKHSIWLAVIFMVAAMFVFDLAMQESRENEAARARMEANSLVNQHLQSLNRRMELSEKKMRLENQFLAPAIGQRIQPLKKPSAMAGVPIHSDRNEETIANDLKGPKQDLMFKNPSAEIQGEIRDYEDQVRHEEAYRREYVRQFIENAKRNGYEVNVDDDLIVTGVRRLPGSVPTTSGTGSGSR